MIVQSHGTFGMLHLGHIRHFEQAKALGGTLIVTITADEFNKSRRNLIFTDMERWEMIQSLRCVDEVCLSFNSGAEKAIDLIRPDIYCKGIEYKGRLPEQKYCEDRGIKVVFTDQDGWSSSDPKAHTSELCKRISTG